ncbi:MAG: hypothetical protein ABIP94_13000 [Planctomycetota bacterium]
MNTARLALLLIATGLLALMTSAQTSPAELIARYQRLDAEHRATVVRNIERRLLRENNDSLQRIQGSQLGKAAYDLAGPARWFEPLEYAPTAQARHLVAADTDEHRTATAGMQRFECLPLLNAAVFYDWQLGKAVRRPRELDYDERFANYANGFAPGADHAVAQALAALDTEAAPRRLGSYFEHLYADRQGKVFADLTLFDAWNSGVRIEMPDTDAVAFARLVLRTQSFVAPLPADRRRERLYEKMREAFAQHREHRTLRLAIAATLVAAEPRLDANYQGLIDRGLWLWQKHDLDTKRVAEFVASTPDRAEFLRQVDAAIGREHHLVDERRQELLDLVALLRDLADYELRNANG